MKVAPLALGTAAFSSDSEGQGVGESNGILGAWTSVHTLPFPPGSFRELLSFAERGVLHETNTSLNTNSNLDFSAYGLPGVLNASDGVGTGRSGRGRNETQAVFQKLLSDGSRQNIGDLLVKGTVQVSGNKLKAEWSIQVVDLLDNVLADFGPASSVGTRIG